MDFSCDADVSWVTHAHEGLRMFAYIELECLEDTAADDGEGASVVALLRQRCRERLGTAATPSGIITLAQLPRSVPSLPICPPFPLEVFGNQ